MGDNGAGKSTLVKIMAGNYPPSAGEIVLEGEPAHFHRPPGRAPERNRDRVPGPRALRQPQRGGQRVPWGASSRSPSSASCANPRPRGDVCARGPAVRGAQVRDPPARRRASDVRRPAPGGWRSRAPRLSDPKIVLMDEPTAAISVRQVAEVLDLIRRLRETDHAVVLISHRMPDVFSVCDRVAVLRRGPQGDRQAHRRDLARGDHRPHHRSHRERMTERRPSLPQATRRSTRR